jgi:hypothetical protein
VTEPSSPPTPAAPWTVERAQAALKGCRRRLLAVTETLRAIRAGLPAPADFEERLEHQRWDVATSILSHVDCVIADNLLCRARHNRFYAEPRIMPSGSATPLLTA